MSEKCSVPIVWGTETPLGYTLEKVIEAIINKKKQ
jgi:hypothetical protein